MKILVLGAAGMLGQKLVARLAADGHVMGQAITHLIRHDVVLCPAPPAADFTIETQIGDLSETGEAQTLIASKPAIIFHLVAIVSGEAEANFEKGYLINFDGTRNLLEAIRKTGEGYCPKLIFTSSIAVFGAPFADAIDDEFFSTPLTSYGTQKAISELLISDYSRKGFMDGISLRMPTICVRPGKANMAASSFFSNIIREPLMGLEAILPVSDSVRHWHISPRRAVELLLHAANMNLQTVGPRRALSMPGVSCTVAEQILALENVAGHKAVQLIKREANETINRIVLGWPQNFNPQRALALGFKADKNFEEIIRIHIEDELKGQIA